LIELARFFAGLEEPLDCTLRFAALGAEEVGMLGSQAYIRSHPQRLRNTELVFNIDQVGGPGKIWIETLGEFPTKKVTSTSGALPGAVVMKSRTDSTSRWQHYRSDLLVAYLGSNIPEWLSTAIERSVEELEYSFSPARGMGSDHRLFALAGIPATGIAIVGNPNHTASDTVEKVRADSLAAAGRIVARVIQRLERERCAGPR
jgi:Zn-dependent M28 family amino/carboxypeptidase